MPIDPATLSLILMGVDTFGRVILTIDQLIQIANSEPSDEQLSVLEAKSKELTDTWRSLAPKPE